MAYTPLIFAALVIAAGGALTAGFAPASWGVGPDDSLLHALVYVELTLALFVPARAGRGWQALAFNAALALACWLATGAAVLAFGFAGDAGWHARGVAFSAWLACGGCVAFAAALNAAPRGRPLLAALFALPPLLHYFTLEYAGASRPLFWASPHWLLARGEGGFAPVLIVLGIAGYAAAAVLAWRRKP